MIRSLAVVTTLAGAALALAAPSASAGCYGTDRTALVCVDPFGSELWRDCVHTGTEPCTPVVVPGPVVTCDQYLVDVDGIKWINGDLTPPVVDDVLELACGL